jgi:hypothetical protein
MFAVTDSLHAYRNALRPLSVANFTGQSAYERHIPTERTFSQHS